MLRYVLLLGLIMAFIFHNIPSTKGTLIVDKVNFFLFDPLEDKTNIDTSLSKNYTITDEGIQILHRTIKQNFTINDKNCTAFKKEDALPYPLFLLNQLFGPNIPEEEKLSKGEIIAISSKNNRSVRTSSSYKYLAPLHHFRFFINVSKESVTKLVIYWNGSFDSSQVRFLLWNYEALGGRGSWSSVRTVNKTGLSTIIIKDSAKDFVSKKGYVDIVVLPALDLSNPPTTIRTYYVSLSVTATQYHKEAIIVTKPINPGSFWTWEAVKWNKLTPQETEIRCFILDRNARPIGSLDGNKEGFTEYYINLCQLSNAYPEIRLKFVLKTKKLGISPYLLNYTVLWQKNERRWMDNLIWNYEKDPRIEEIGKDYIISVPICCPAGYWWGKLNIGGNTSNGGRIVVSILDENKNTILANVSSGYNLSSLCCKIIRLKAKFEGNLTEIPILENWSITFNESKEPPRFEKKEIGYVNKPVINFEVRVEDKDPGLLPSTAKYKLIYKKNGTEKTFISDWLPAKCPGENCVKEATITAENVHIFYDHELENILNLSGEREITLSYIQFYIEDAAGNGASEKYPIKIDTIPPRSRILENVSTLGFYHGFEEIHLSAEAEDNETGVRSVTLYYFVSYDNKTFDGPFAYKTLSSPPWNWTFRPLGSAYYAFLTKAVDNAGNVEEKEEKEVIILCDIRKPNPPSFEREVHWLSSNKINFVNFSDDILLSKIRYKIKGEPFTWHDVATNINSKSYSASWMLDTYDWEMMEEGKEYHVYFDIIDKVGNEYTTSGDSEALIVAKDTTYPTAEIDKVKLWQWKTPIELSIYTKDKESGIRKVELFYQHSPDNRTWSDWKLYGLLENFSGGEYTWKFSAPDGDGYYRIYIKAIDIAGNEKASDYIVVGVTIFPIKYVALFVSTFIIFSLAVLIVIRKST